MNEYGYVPMTVYVTNMEDVEKLNKFYAYFHGNEGCGPGGRFGFLTGAHLTLTIYCGTSPVTEPFGWGWNPGKRTENTVQDFLKANKNVYPQPQVAKKQKKQKKPIDPCDEVTITTTYGDLAKVYALLGKSNGSGDLFYVLREMLDPCQKKYDKFFYGGRFDSDRLHYAEYSHEWLKFLFPQETENQKKIRELREKATEMLAQAEALEKDENETN